MKQEKQKLRTSARAKRASLSKSEIATHSGSICEHLTGSSPWKKAGTVALYASFRSEVETRPLFDQAVLDGKRIVLPKVTGPDEPLAFFEVRPDSGGAWPLVEGAFSVYEPDLSCAKVPLTEIDLLIVPALALDTTGARLGWGGGFYDRTIELCSAATVLAVVFDCQIMEMVPAAPHDRPVSGWISEKGLFSAG